MLKHNWILFTMVFITVYVLQFIPKSHEQIERDQQRAQDFKDFHYELQDIHDDLYRASKDAHRIEEDRHPEGYSQ